MKIASAGVAFRIEGNTRTGVRSSPASTLPSFSRSRTMPLDDNEPPILYEHPILLMHDFIDAITALYALRALVHACVCTILYSYGTASLRDLFFLS
jgi:hypothetical protein